MFLQRNNCLVLVAFIRILAKQSISVTVKILFIMADYSSYAERDAFSQDICDLVNEYLLDPNAFADDVVLAINNKTNEIQLASPSIFSAEWETYPIQTIIRNNEDNTGREVDSDVTYEIASSFFFVR